MANQTLPSTKGPIHAVPCPFCGKPNDFRDLEKGFATQSFVGEGDEVTCDHCKGVMQVTGMQSVTFVAVRQFKLPKQVVHAQQQQQRQQPAGAGGFLKKLLGK